MQTTTTNQSIDLTIWITQQKLANELSVSLQVVNAWVKRGRITSQFFEHFDKTLVDKTSIKIKKYLSKNV
jgi:hypothetical protein